MGRGTCRVVVRVALALITTAAVVFTLVSCVFGDRSSSEAQALVQRFSELLDRRDVPGAAALTSYPNAAAASITQLFDGMAPGTVHYELSQLIELDTSAAFFTIDAAWRFGPGKDWSYRVQGNARKFAVGWRIAWNPAVLMPGLRNGRSARLVRTDAAPPRVRDIDGKPLMDEQTVDVVDFDAAAAPDRAASATAIARTLEPVAPLVTAASILRDVDVAHGSPSTVVTLREDDFAVLERRLVRIPGVVVHQQPKLITDDRRISSPILDAVRVVWQQGRDATAGWAVHVVSQGDTVGRLAGNQVRPGPDLTATLDQRLQLAAEAAVAGVGNAASVVAIRPSSGAVLAVAQNEAADTENSAAFATLYPAGRSLELFTAAAKKQRQQDISIQDLQETLGRFGIGEHLVVPGSSTQTGRLARRQGPFEPVFNAHKSNPLQVSTFGMAVAAATIAGGTTVQPMITLDKPAASDAPAVPGVTLDRVRAAQRESMAAPAVARVLRNLPGVVGYAASAGDDQWFIGSRGDLAFAVHLGDAADYGTDAATKTAARMLRAFGRPAK